MKTRISKINTRILYPESNWSFLHKRIRTTWQLKEINEINVILGLKSIDEGWLKASINLPPSNKTPLKQISQEWIRCCKRFVRCGKIFAFPNNTEPWNLFQKSIDSQECCCKRKLTLIWAAFFQIISKAFIIYDFVQWWFLGNSLGYFFNPSQKLMFKELPFRNFLCF